MTSTAEDLFEAIEAGHAGRVRDLVEAEPAVATSRDATGVSALMRALYRFDVAVVDAIAVRVAELDVFEAAAFGDLDRLIELVSAEPTLATAYSGDGFTALHFAAFFGRHEAAELLLARGAEVDALGRGWMTGTALHSAVSRMHADVVRTLLEADANPNTRQSAGWTPLHAAAANADLEAVLMLLDAGADPAATNDEGRSVMDLAVEKGDDATVERIRAAVQAP
jgi:ankyrin repeat protein